MGSATTCGPRWLFPRSPFRASVRVADDPPRGQGKRYGVREDLFNPSQLPEAAFEPLEATRIRYLYDSRTLATTGGTVRCGAEPDSCRAQRASERRRPGSTLRSGSNLRARGIGAGVSCLGGLR